LFLFHRLSLASLFYHPCSGAFSSIASPWPLYSIDQSWAIPLIPFQIPCHSSFSANLSVPLHLSTNLGRSFASIDQSWAILCIYRPILGDPLHLSINLGRSFASIDQSWAIPSIFLSHFVHFPFSPLAACLPPDPSAKKHRLYIYDNQIPL